MYRKLKRREQNNKESDSKANKHSLHELQKDIIEGAREHVDEKDDIDVLAKVRHHGCPTNLIDFTRNYLIALYFACRSDSEADGRLIILPENREDKLVEPNGSNQGEYVNYVSKIKDARLLLQAGVFVHRLEGYIDIDDAVQIIGVEKDHKESILEYLLNSHNISEDTLFNDLYGFIEIWKEHG